jgi:hypothetical protein
MPGTAFAITKHIIHNYHTLSFRWSPFLFLLILIFACSSPGASPASVTLTWDANAEPDIAGYRVYYGTVSGSYTDIIDVGTSTTGTVSNLPEAQTFFVVTAYNSAGAESLPSNEVSYPSASPSSPSLVNVSTRAFVQTDDDVMIGGFIIEGASAKKVVLRALGSSLQTAGLTGTLTNPILELHDSTGATIAWNTRWDTSDQGLIATGLAPSGQAESAMMTVLPPGAYTVVIRGQNNTTGIALFELYDVDPGSSKIVNISTRANVNTGDNVVIGGFIIGSDQPTKVIIRAIGPSLASYGVPGPLQDPVLELHGSSGSLIFLNDNWRTNQEQQILDSGLQPANDSESAIIATLQPGAYTAIVRGAGNTTGVALVEVYNLGQ